MCKLNSLIQECNSKYSSFYNGDLYSHTPMALISLSELGANDDRLQEYFIQDIKKLEPKHKTDTKIDNTNWKNYLGHFELESSYNQFFEDEFNKLGLQGILNKYFDFLMKGVGAAAFHPLIRLSYAVKRKDKIEIIQGLGTWAASFLDLNITPYLEGNLSCKGIIAKLQDENFNNEQKIIGDTIADRMTSVSKMPDFQKVANKLDISELTINNLEEILLWIFSQSNNFTLLHAITSHHAFESLCKFSKNEKEVRVYY